MYLHDDQIFLRPLSVSDVTEEYVKWMNTPDIVQFIGSRNKNNSKENIEKYVATFDNKGSFHLGIFIKESEHHVGNISIRCDLANKTASTGILIGDKSVWGSDVVIKARRLVLKFLFDDMDIFKVTGTPLSRNIPALFNYKKQGFIIEGIQKDQVLLGDNTRADLVHFAMFRCQYRNSQSDQV